MRSIVKKQTGITLIALVVTIIVLIILAGVSIAMLVGENGIITQAQRAAQETEIKGDEEKIRLAMVAAQIASNGNSNIEKDNLEIALLENGKLIEYYTDEENSTRREGNIYIGIVRNIIKGMQAAFVNIGTEKNSFIHLKDILPKIDEKKEKLE